MTPRGQTSGLSRQVGVIAACALILGNVIGASIFLLPGQLAADAGPGVVFSYLLAATLSLATIPLMAILGTSFRSSGALFVAIATLLGRRWGFLAVWTYGVLIMLALAVLALGFAQYASFLVPGLSERWVGSALLVTVGVINLAGIQTATWFQAALVAWFVATLAVFGIGGVASGAPELLSPLLPRGWDPVLAAAVPAYFSFLGFNTVVDIAEEVRDPGRTIPLSLGISFAATLVAYTLVPLGITSQIPWQELSDVKAPVAEAAVRFLPLWFGHAVTYAALAAAATSVLAAFLAGSRWLYGAARRGLLPAIFGEVNARTRVPAPALILLIVLGVATVQVGATVKQFATLTVLGMMIVFSLSAVALLRLPRHAPSEWARSSLRPGLWGRIAIAGASLLVSLFFFANTALDNPAGVVALLVTIALGWAAYPVLARRGEE